MTSRVVAACESRDALLAAIDVAKRTRARLITALLPVYDSHVVDAMGARSIAGWITTLGAIAGGIAGLWFTVWTVDQWPLVIVGGKPLHAWPPFIIIGVEMAILVAVLAVTALFLLVVWRGRAQARIVGEVRRGAPFVLVVGSSPEHASELCDLLRAHGAVTCRIV